MKVRRATRIATTYLTAPILVALFLMVVAANVYLLIEIGPTWNGMIQLVLILVLGSYAGRFWTRMPTGRDVKARYLEFAALIDTCRHGQQLRYSNAGQPGAPDEAFFLCIRKGFKRGVLRLQRKDAEPSRIDQKGWGSAEWFLCTFAIGTALRIDAPGVIDTRGYFTPANLGPVPRFGYWKATWYRTRTGQGFARADELEALVNQLRHAQPVPDEA